MAGLFSIDDEIDFSDDDELFNVNLSGKENNDSLCNNINIKDSSLCNSKTYNVSDSTYINGNTPVPIISQQKSNNNIRKKFSFHSPRLKTNAIFENFLTDDDDDLLSQIDMPIDINTVTPENNNKAILRVKNNNKPSSKLDIKHAVINIPKEIHSANISQGGRSVNSSPSSYFNEHGSDFSSSKNKTTSISKCSATVFPKVNSIDSLASHIPKTAGIIQESNFNLSTAPSLVTPSRSCSGKQLIRTLKRKSTNAQGSLIPSKQTPLRQRKFPGPAGILPKIKNADQLNALKSPDFSKDKRTLTPLTPKTPVEPIMNLSQDDELSSSQMWQDVLAYIEQYFPRIIVTKIATIISKATVNELVNGKVELCIALIKSFAISGSGGKVVLKDKSGQIYGTIHKNVLEEFEPYLKQGTGIILKGVSVFSPSSKKHYINITPSNIVQLFPSDLNGTLNQTQLSQTSQSKLINNGISPKQIPSNIQNGQNIFKSSDDNIFETDSADIDNFFSDDILV